MIILRVLPALALLGAIGCGGGGAPEISPPYPRSEPEWIARHDAIVAEAGSHSHDVAIVGDSIAALMGGAPVDQKAVGDAALHDAIGSRSVLNCGIRGDRVETVEWRVEHDELGGQDPKLILLLAGTNNLGLQSASTIAEEVARLARAVRKACPTATVLVLGVLPRDLPDSTTRHHQQAVKAELVRQKFALYRDVPSSLLDANGQFLDGVTLDRIHPTAAGFTRILEALKGTLDQILTAP